MIVLFGWYHRLNIQELEQTLGDGEGQGSPVCCRPWGCKESDASRQQNNTIVCGGVCLGVVPSLLQEEIRFALGERIYDNRVLLGR